MTTKEKAISVIKSLDDNATLDEMIDRLYLLRKIELGIAQADAGDVMEHETFMAELERENVRRICTKSAGLFREMPRRRLQRLCDVCVSPSIG